MRYRGFLDAIIGRFYFPTRPAKPDDMQPSELVLVGERPHFKNAGGTAERYLLTSADRGQPAGVASLDNAGTIPESQLPSGINGSTSIGQIIMWPGDPLSLPGSHLACDGAAYLRAEFPNLFAIIRTRCGQPPDDRYFRVPDMRGRSPVGAITLDQARAGSIRKILPVTVGNGYTVGTHPFTATGGTFTTPVSGEIDVVSKVVPGIGATGVIAAVRILVAGNYTDLGAQVAPSNCGIVLQCPGMGSGALFTYDLYAAPLVASPALRQPWGVSISNPGSAYATPPAVSITGPSITGVTAVAIVRGGLVVDVIVTDRGNGDIAGATVAFSGGGGSAAAASVAVWTTDVVMGDYGGEQGHVQLEHELAAHTHVAPKQAGKSRRERDSGTGVEGLGSTGSTGGGGRLPLYQPYIGVGYYIRAA